MTAQRTYFANRAGTTLSSSLGVGSTTINVVDTTNFPAIPFYLAIDPASDSDFEVVLVDSAKSSTTFTLSSSGKRGQDGTTDKAHASGATVKIVPIAAAFTDMHDRLDQFGTELDTGLATVVTDHGALTGLADDDHAQYLNGVRHDARDHTAAMSTVVLDDISNVDLTGIAAGAMLYYDGTSIVDLGIGTAGQSLVVNSGATAPEWGAAAAAGPTVKVKPSNESVTSSVVVQDDDHLTASLAANKRYTFRFLIKFSGADGLRINLPAMTGATAFYNASGYTSVWLPSGWADFGTEYGGGGFSSAYPVIIEGGVVMGGTAGTLKLQWAQTTSSGTPVVVQAGSSLIVSEAS